MASDSIGSGPSIPVKARLALGAVLGAALVLALAWTDVLPGGWTLRGWVEPHASRQARAQEAHSQERLRLFAEQNKQTPADSIVFAGSSTIERFPLETMFPKIPIQNRGIGDETCEHFLRRLEQSRPQAQPVGWVLYLASVDFRRLHSTPSEIVQRVERVLDRILVGAPKPQLSLIGILPELGMPEDMTQRLAATNSALAQLCERRDVVFVSTARSPITDSKGSLSSAYAADRLHLNQKGYEVLARWIQDANPWILQR